MSDPNINMKPMKSQIRAPAGKSEMWIIIHRHRQSHCSSGRMEYLISLKAQVERVKPWIKDKIIRLLSHWEGKISLCKGSLELDHEWHTKKHHRPLPPNLQIPWTRLLASTWEIGRELWIEAEKGQQVQGHAQQWHRGNGNVCDTFLWNVCSRAAPGRNWFLPAAIQGLQGKFGKPRLPAVEFFQVPLFNKASTYLQGLIL